MNYQRHDLVWLDPAGHYPDALSHWLNNGYPCVIPRQDMVESHQLKVAWSLPRDKSATGRMAVTIDAWQVIRHQPPPPLIILSQLGIAIDSLIAEFQQLGIAVGVFGSFAWQYLTGEKYLHDGSDIDLLLPIKTARQLQRLPDLLQSLAEISQRRVDGEIGFPDGRAVAWREWFSASGELLVKSIDNIEIIGRNKLIQQLQ